MLLPKPPGGASLSQTAPACTHAEEVEEQCAWVGRYRHVLLKLDQCRWLASALYSLGSKLMAVGRQEGAQPLLEAACQASLACALICSEAQVRMGSS